MTTEEQPTVMFPASSEKSLGHYRLTAKLGAGGMGEVYLAEDTRLDRKVALKLLPAEFTQDAERVRRFKQEAKAASALNHPNIISVYDIGESEAGRFIVMELVAGRTLRTVIGEDNSLETLLSLGAQMAKALSAAHAAGITHRDIKPDNIMVRDDGYVKVLDFGLARLGDTQKSERGTRNEEDETWVQASPDIHPSSLLAHPFTLPGTLMGTVAYMSPEQARGEAVGHPSDMFALGIVLYELATGQHPFKAETMVGYLHAITSQTPPPPSQWQPSIPAALDGLLLQMLEKEAGKRPTASEVAQALQAMERRGTPDNKRQEFNLQVAAVETEDTLKRELLTPLVLPVLETETNEAPTIMLPSVTTDTNSIAITSPNNVLREHKLSARQTLLLSLLLSVLLLAGVGLWLFFRSTNNTPIESIAILPFTNASGDPEMEYLSDGLTESLINSLAQIPRLRVLPRTTVFRFKGKADDPQRIGQELGVRAVLTGRVQQRGDSLVIQTELIDVTGGAQLWGDRYNPKLANLLAAQSEVAQAIAGGLRLKLSGAEQQQLAKKGTENNEAYQLYLKGMFWRNKGGRENFRKGVDAFNQALEKDPNYAPAYAGLAACYTNLGLNYGSDSKDNYAKGKAAALKAVSLDSNLAEAHASLGVSLLYFDWDFAGAEREFKQASELNPDSASAHRSYAGYLLIMGRHQEAITEAKRAMQLDPLSTTTNHLVGQAYLHARQYDQAIEQYLKLLEMDRGFANGYNNLSSAYGGKGQYEEAIAAAQAGLRIEDSPGMLSHLGYAYAKAGQRGAAQKILAQLLTLAQQQEVAPASIAAVYIGLGDQDQAFAWLEKAYAARSANLLFLKASPRYDSLRSDPRFADLVRRIGLPE